MVVNIETTVNSIQRALEEAELMADRKSAKCMQALPAAISAVSTPAAWLPKDKVTATDVARVIETAKAVNIPTDQQVLHVLTQEFIVDSQEDIATHWHERPRRSACTYRRAVSAARTSSSVRRCGLRSRTLFSSRWPPVWRA